MDAHGALDALPDKSLRDQAAKEIGAPALQVGGCSVSLSLCACLTERGRNGERERESSCQVASTTHLTNRLHPPATPSTRHPVRPPPHPPPQALDVAAKAVGALRDASAYRWVDLAGVFGKLSTAKAGAAAAGRAAAAGGAKRAAGGFGAAATPVTAGRR